MSFFGQTDGINWRVFFQRKKDAEKLTGFGEEWFRGGEELGGAWSHSVVQRHHPFTKSAAVSKEEAKVKKNRKILEMKMGELVSLQKWKELTRVSLVLAFRFTCIHTREGNSLARAIFSQVLKLTSVEIKNILYFLY